MCLMLGCLMISVSDQTDDGWAGELTCVVLAEDFFLIKTALGLRA